MMLPAYAACLGAATPAPADIVAELGPVAPTAHGIRRALLLGRRGVGDRVQGWLYEPGAHPKGAVLVVAEAASPSPDGLIADLLQRHRLVLVLKPFPRQPGDATYPDADFFVTYNLPPAAEQAQDVLTALSWLHGRDANWRPAVLGLGAPALATLAGQTLDERVSRVAVDCGGQDFHADETYRHSLFLPSIRRLGGLDTIVALAAPRLVWLFNAAAPSGTGVYQPQHVSGALRVDGSPADARHLVDWLAG